MSALEWVDTLQGPGGIILGIAGTKLFSRRKDNAEATKVLTETAVLLVGPLNDRIGKLEDRIQNLEDANAEATGKLRRAINYIRTLLTWVSDQHPGAQPPVPPADLIYLT